MSIKKSSLFVIAVIVIVSLGQIVSGGGNAMELNMGESALSFSGIDEFRYEITYADIVETKLEEEVDWDALGGHEFGAFRVGEVTRADGQQYVLFVTTRADNAIVATLADGSQMIFNYNNTYSTQEIYNMLLQNLD